MDNLEDLCRSALKEFFTLLKKNEEYLKARQKLIMNPGNQSEQTVELLEPQFEKDFDDFNNNNIQLIEYLKTTPARSVEFKIKHGVDMEGNYTIDLDKEDKLVVMNLS
jgi:hypothetical protein